MKIIEMRRTCGQFPAQWEGKLEDGRYLYVRYRHGGLRIGLGETFYAAVDDENGFYLDLTDSDGKHPWMDYDLLQRLAPQFDWPESENDGLPMYE